MGERIDQFCENLRTQLTTFSNDMQALAAQADADAKEAEQQVRKQLEIVKSRIEQNRAQITAARSDVRKWAEEGKATAAERVVEWKAKREKANLQNWADMADLYAAATSVVASAAIDEAEQASLQAWLTRKETERAKV